MEGPADLAAVLLGSLAHCLDNEAALACFGELGRAVRPGGLLVLELPHPSDLWGGYCLEDDQFVEAWDAEVGGDGRAWGGGGAGGLEGVSVCRLLAAASANKPCPLCAPPPPYSQSDDGSRTVLVEWGREGDAFDLQEQLLHRTVGLSVYEGDDLASSEVEVVPQRQFTLQVRRGAGAG